MSVKVLNRVKNQPLNMPIHKEILKINVFKAKKYGGEK